MMVELLIAAVFFALMALSLSYRIAKGPSAADRAVAGDSCDSLLCCAMILFSMYSGRRPFSYSVTEAQSHQRKKYGSY